MKTIGLGPVALVLPDGNERIIEFPPDEEAWDLIIETINLVRKINRRKRQEVWTDGTWIP